MLSGTTTPPTETLDFHAPRDGLPLDVVLGHDLRDQTHPPQRTVFIMVVHNWTDGTFPRGSLRPTIKNAFILPRAQHVPPYGSRFHAAFGSDRDQESFPGSRVFVLGALSRRLP